MAHIKTTQVAKSTPFDNSTNGFVATDTQSAIEESKTAGQLYDHWNGATQYTSKNLRRYTNKATTDANSRVTLYLTTDGTATGTALFSSVLSVQSTGVYAGTVSTSVPNAYVESLSTDLKTLTLRATTGLTIVTILLGGSNTVQFAGAGYVIYITVEGIRNT